MLDDRTIAIDALATAKDMAVLNLESALNMDAPESKRAHQMMSQEDANIADRLQQILRQRGWDQPVPADPQQTQKVLSMFGSPVPGATEQRSPNFTFS